MIGFEPVEAPVTRIFVRRHFRRMTRGYARGELVHLQLRHFRNRAFLVDHLEEVRAQFGELFEVCCLGF